MKALLIDQIAKVNYKYSYSLANALVSRGVTAEMVIDLKEERENAEFKRYRFFNTDEKNIGKGKKLFNYISSFRKIIRLIKKNNYDVIHTQWIIFSPLDYWYIKELKRIGIRVVMTIHDILPFNEKPYDRFFYKRIYRMADEIIVQTKENKQRFYKEFPQIKNNVYVIPHGHFLDYVTDRNQEQARKTLKLPADRFEYLFFGQIKKVKGVEVLLRAYALLLEKHPALKNQVYLVIAGSVWKTDFGECREIIDKNRLSDFVREDIRYIPDNEVDDYYGSADVCVLPYLDVYQSGVLQLTYAHHKPAIVTRIPAFVEIVNEDNGFLCRKNDPESLMEAMYKAFQNADALSLMGNLGYEKIRHEYDWDPIAEKILQLYSCST